MTLGKRSHPPKRGSAVGPYGLSYIFKHPLCDIGVDWMGRDENIVVGGTGGLGPSLGRGGWQGVEQTPASLDGNDGVGCAMGDESRQTKGCGTTRRLNVSKGNKREV